MPWGIALTDESGDFVFFRSTSLNSEGNPKTMADLDGKLWDVFASPNEIKNCWDETISSQDVDHFAQSTCRQNGLGCHVSMYPVPEKAKTLVFINYSPNSLINDIETNICFQLVQGVTVTQLSDQLRIPVAEVEQHRQSAMEKLHVKTTEQLGAVFARSKSCSTII